MNLTKTYFLVDKNEARDLGDGVYEFDFPPEFYGASGSKWIEVRYCYALFNGGYLVADSVLHSDFIKRDNYLDSAVSVINVLNNGAKPDKYLYPEGATKRFKIWFSNLKNEKVIPDDFQMKMLLIYYS